MLKPLLNLRTWRYPTDIHRFFSFVNIDEKHPECLTWAGTTTGTQIRKGVQRKYGRFRVDGQRPLAHRWIYEQCVSEIPYNCDVHHTCENTLCVNTYHLIVMDKYEHRNTWRS